MASALSVATVISRARNGGIAIMRAEAARTMWMARSASTPLTSTAAALQTATNGGARRWMSSNDHEEEPMLVSKKSGVTTLSFNRPKKLNAWTGEVMSALQEQLYRASNEADTKVVILTGSGKYYSAGVDLSAILKPMMPASLHSAIVENNQNLFDMFLDFPKPIMAAVNGPAIGATVTSATLCDAIIAAEEATFSTPFGALGIPPEGCSSVHFADLIGAENAQKMLGKEGWKPTAKEAEACGLVTRVVPGDQLLTEAQQLAEEWIRDGRTRTIRGNRGRDALKQVNAEESIALADAFLSEPFLKAQLAFLESKGKDKPAKFFKTLLATRPFWKHLY